MKNLFSATTLLIIMIFCIFSCGERRASSSSQPATVANTPEEAAAKAKTDLLELLKSGNDIKLGIDPAALEKAQPGPAIKQVSLNFEKLLSVDSTTSDLNQLAGSEMNILFPFVSENKVEAVAEIVKADKGWNVAALANAKKTNDLTLLRQSGGDSLIRSITIYEVPNLNATLYSVNRENGSIIYTDYGGRFSIQQGVQFRDFISVLRDDAIRFQKRFGDKIKKEKLLK